MGLLSFIKEAGEKLFGKGEAQAAQADAEAGDAGRAAGKAIEDYIRAMNLDATDLAVDFDGGSGIVTVSGVAADQETREKIVLCCGNVDGVSQVDDQMSVEATQDEAQYYTVVRGDTLSKISKEFYGNANKYMVIFEANKPMLKHPDKIYPGQMLRIPPLS
ncbi:MAG: peptidoglycan-binding protein LysM [Burkholderiaceae bacterium]